MSDLAITRAVETSTVRVEKPFPDYALPRVWSWIQAFRKRVTDDFSPKTLEEFVEQWESLKDTRQTWGVWRGEELGGMVSAEPWGPGIVVSHALFKKEFWGSATTRRALELIYQELFDSGVRKIMGFPFASNHAIISLGKSIGARTEGVLHGQTIQNGKPVDLTLLGLLKEDFATCQQQ